MVNSEAPPWYKIRHYLHFDNPVGPHSASKIAMVPNTVEKHSFYPFIHTVIKTVKLVKNKTTGIIERKEKKRDISYAAHADSHIYAYYAHLLNQRYEEALSNAGLENSVLAFRTMGKSNIEFAQIAFNDILCRQECDVIALDITGFFDNLDHYLLRKAWAKLLSADHLPPDHYNIYRSLTRWCRVDKRAVYNALNISLHNPKKHHRKRLCEPNIFRTTVRPLLQLNNQSKGIPQGTPISAALSNIYMLSFDAQMQSFANQINARYLRYCDDIIMIAPKGTLDAIKTFVNDRINDFKLEIQTDKTEERTFSLEGDRLRTTEPLQYLGFTFDGKNVRIRSSSVARYCDRMKRGIRTANNARRKYNKLRMAKKRSPKGLYLKKLFRRYSYLGRRNFMSYAYRSAQIMKSQTIKKQLKPLLKKLDTTIDT